MTVTTQGTVPYPPERRRRPDRRTGLRAQPTRPRTRPDVRPTPPNGHHHHHHLDRHRRRRLHPPTHRPQPHRFPSRQLISQCAPVLQAFSTAIVTTQTAYSTAAAAEQAARAGLPWTAALAAAITAETAAVTAHQAAPSGCGWARRPGFRSPRLRPDHHRDGGHVRRAPRLVQAMIEQESTFAPAPDPEPARWAP